MSSSIAIPSDYAQHGFAQTREGTYLQRILLIPIDGYYDEYTLTAIVMPKAQTMRLTLRSETRASERMECPIAEMKAHNAMEASVELKCWLLMLRQGLGLQPANPKLRV